MRFFNFLFNYLVHILPSL